MIWVIPQSRLNKQCPFLEKQYPYFTTEFSILREIHMYPLFDTNKKHNFHQGIYLAKSVRITFGKVFTIPMAM